MRFPHSMAVTLTAFLLAYGCWLFPQLRSDRELESFGATEPPAVSEEASRREREVPVQIVRTPRETPSTRSGTERPSAAPRVMQPSPAPDTTDRHTPDRSAAAGITLRRLDLMFDVDLPDDEFLRLIRQQDCEIVVLKVQADVIEDAFLPGRAELVERVSGPLADRRVDQYRNSHPLNRHFWIHWQVDAESAIVREARLALDRHGLTLADYRVFLVLSQQLSQEIQEQLLVEARNERVDPADITYAKVVLHHNGRGLHPELLTVEFRSDRPAATGAGWHQTPDETYAAARLESIQPPAASSTTSTGHEHVTSIRP